MNILKLNFKFTTILYTILHFCVDGICCLIIFSSLYSKTSPYNTYVFLVYNILAFVTQPLVGLLQDKIKSEKITLGISILLLFLGIIFKFSAIISPIFLGLGNSFFHISGGKHVIEKSNNNIICLGLFVSTGAIGLILGQLYYSTLLLIIFLSLLVISSAILFFTKMEKSDEVQELKYDKGIIIGILLVVVVFIRSFVGKASPAEFLIGNVSLLLIYIAMAAGKFLGGICSRLIGINKTIIISMGLSTILLVFGSKLEVTYLIGICLFNFSMPITLYLMTKILPYNKALGFGILAAVLFPGFLLGLLYFDIVVIKIIVAALNLLSIVFILIVTKKMGIKKC